MAAMRVCQPAPVAFHASSTSGGRRRLIATRGAAALGRPRSLACNVAGSLGNGLARTKSASVHSGFSWSVISGSARLLIPLHLALVCLAKTDDPDAGCGFREYQHVQPVIQKAQRLPAHFAVVLTSVFDEQRCLVANPAARSNDRPRSAMFHSLLAGSWPTRTQFDARRIAGGASRAQKAEGRLVAAFGCIASNDLLSRRARRACGRSR